MVYESYAIRIINSDKHRSSMTSLIQELQHCILTSYLSMSDIIPTEKAPHAFNLAADQQHPHKIILNWYLKRHQGDQLCGLWMQHLSINSFCLIHKIRNILTKPLLVCFTLNVQLLSLLHTSQHLFALYRFSRSWYFPCVFPLRVRGGDMRPN